MLDVTKSLPDDPAELRAFTALLLAEVKSQPVLFEKLRRQLDGHRAHRFGASSVTPSGCNWPWRRVDLSRFGAAPLIA